MLKAWFVVAFSLSQLILNITSGAAVAGNRYSSESLWNISERQPFVLDAWHIPDTWVNPSMVKDPTDSKKIVIVWRMPDKRKRDKVGYMWLDLNFTVLKCHDMIGKKPFLSLICICRVSHSHFMQTQNSLTSAVIGRC